LGLRDDIAAMIVTGDFMTHGNFTDQIKVGAIAELNALRAELGLERDQLIAVPGNHDVVRYPEERRLTSGNSRLKTKHATNTRRDFGSL
jgi:predicted phosphodiesterase